jgi:hypothetical protein
MKKYLILYVIFIAIFCQTAFAAKNAVKSPAIGREDDSYLFNSNATIGIGLIGHYFILKDDFREGGNNGIPGDDDEIKYIYGLNINPEILLNKALSINSKYGFAAGYRLEYITGGYKYSYGPGGTKERKVNILNNIFYCSVSQPLDSNKYCLVGILGGIGPSRYKMNIDTSSSTLDAYDKSVWGLVMPAGAFIDWGGDGIGARFGVEMLLSIYTKEDGIRPNSTGIRAYLNLRYSLF